MDQLKLIALDEQDLGIFSAHLQDAVLKVKEFNFAPATKQFGLTLNRFVWEKGGKFLRPHNERRKSLLHFDRVLGVQLSGIDRSKPEEVLSLMTVSFTAGDTPAGTVELLFSGGGKVRLDVECIEARLADLGGAWEASSRPAHRN